MFAYSTSDLWKRTFFVFFNFRLLTPYFCVMTEFYRAIMELTLQGLVWQRPFLRPWLPFLKNFFLPLAEAPSCPRISLKSKFAQEFPGLSASFQRIADHLYQLWTDSTALEDFVEAVFSLPALIGSATGFTNVFYFADNMEYLDFDLARTPPFQQSIRSCFVTEIFKGVLETGNFVISAQSDARLMEVLSPLEQVTDLRPTMEYVSTAGILTDDDTRVIHVDLQDEGVSFDLDVGKCAGVPAFVALWRELNDAFDEYDRAEQSESEDRDELLLLLMAQAQHVIELLFVFPEKSELLVTAVRR
jgi:hypothetical protein